MPTLYLIRGVPGSGKSSFARDLEMVGLVDKAFEADQYFTKDGVYNFDPTKLHAAHVWCQDRARMYLALNGSVAVSNTSTTEKEVAIYAKIAAETGAQFVSLIVENRHCGVNSHGVPPEKIEQMKNRFTVKL
jgi:predicted kinase